MHIDFMREVAENFPVVDNPLEVTSLRIWHCKYKSLSALSAYSRLEVLVIGSFPDVSFEVLNFLPCIRSLKIVHLPQIASLSPIASLDDLQSLSLATLPSWDAARRRTMVHSLAPLAGLRHLRHLELFGVCPPDRSLAKLYPCTWLKTARFSQYPKETVAGFYASTGAVNEFNPDIEG
jgi:hypothetical protein